MSKKILIVILTCLCCFLCFQLLTNSKPDQSASTAESADSNEAVDTDDSDDSQSIPAGNAVQGQIFQSQKIPNTIFQKMKGVSYPEGCQVARSELRYLQVTYYGFDQESHVGELIVNKAIAQDVLSIFRELYQIQYPIESIQLIDIFAGSDEASMEADNTSCFNYRTVAGSETLSNHAKGLAIDVNPLYNPYVKTTDGKTIVEPSTATDYVDRSLSFPYKITTEDPCYQIFTKYGFTWGGSWNSCKDYQHFEKTP